MSLDKEKLRSNPPRAFGTHPPWVPVPTFAAANFLNVHLKTLLLWRRQGVGPQAVPKDTYIHNQLYWLPGKLLEWWEATALGQGRSYQQICDEWAKANALLVLEAGRPELPERPEARHLVRRERSWDQARKAANAT